MNTTTMHADHAATTTTTATTEAATDHPRVLTIREAAELCGMTRDAMRGRVERGSVQSVLRDGVRKIPVAELRRVGLLDHASVAGSVAGVDGFHGVVGSVGGFVEVFERLHAENVAAVARAVAAETRLQLERQTTSETTAAVEMELHEARARVAQLEAQLLEVQALPRRRWFGIRRG